MASIALLRQAKKSALISHALPSAHCKKLFMDDLPLLLTADSTDRLRRSQEAMADQAIDMAWETPKNWQPQQYQTTLAAAFSISGPATYSKGRNSTLHFAPSPDSGWWFNRSDLPEQLPIMVSPRNVWTAQRSIVLRAGAPANYVRMTEHIIAQRLGLGLDNSLISLETGDPPLFDVGSLPLLEALQQAGLKEDRDKPLRYWTVKEPVAIMNHRDGFLLFKPAPPGDRRLTFDVAIDFPNIIGQQRIQFTLTPEVFRYGSEARTNCSAGLMLYCQTIGKLFADTRNLGYTKKNILIAGKKRYHNQPTFLHQEKSLEAVWHRACLDLLAALSLHEDGRLAGHITSYKAGHALDAQLLTVLYIRDLLEQH